MLGLVKSSLSVVPVEFIHGRNSSRSHKHDLWSNFVAKSLNAENLLRVQRQVKAMKLYEPAFQTKTANQQPWQPRYRKALSSRHHAIRDDCFAKNGLEDLRYIRGVSSSDKSGTSGEKHKQTLHGLRDELLNPTPARVQMNARRGTHRWSAVRSTQPDLRSLRLQRHKFQRVTGLSTLCI